jgi:flagella basal body P-ring formation protein FlgA
MNARPSTGLLLALLLLGSATAPLRAADTAASAFAVAAAAALSAPAPAASASSSVSDSPLPGTQAAAAGAALADTTSAGTSTYSPEDLLSDLSRELSNRYKANGDLHLDFLRPWSPFDASVGPVSVTVLEAPSLLSSSLLVRVRFSSGEKTVGETSLFLRAQLLREVWVVRNSPERGGAFNPAELDTRRVDTLRERDTIAISEPTSDLTFNRPIQSGRILTWRDVSRRALVRRGQVIEVSATDGLLTVNMKALAMENGTAGEMVRVRNLESKKEFTAQVVADSRALVRL